MPTGDMVASEQRRQHQIDHVRLGRTETARCGDNRDLVLICHQEQVARFDGSEEPLYLTADLQHRLADNIFWTRRRRSGSHQDRARLGSQ